MYADGKGRTILSRVADGVSQALGLTQFGSLATTQVEPARLEMTLAKKRFIIGNSAAITGIGPVTALPTTAAQWTISPRSSAESLVFEEIGMYLTAGTPGVGGILLACLFQTPVQTAAVTDAGVGIFGSTGDQDVSGIVVKSAVTVTQPAAPVWYPIASNGISANVTAFAASTFLEHRDLQGSIVVPPGWGLGLAVVAPAGTTPLFAPFATLLKLEL